MNFIRYMTMHLVKAAKGNPVKTTGVVLLFWFMFSIVEAEIEKLIFGERFAHGFDFVFAAGFIAYAIYAVYGCVLYNTHKDSKDNNKKDQIC